MPRSAMSFQHHVTPQAYTIGMPSRIVVSRAAHQRHEQRDFRQVELRERLAEVELAGKAKAMNGATAVLAKEDLIDVRVHEIRLAEVRIERDRHDGFVGLCGSGCGADRGSSS